MIRKTFAILLLVFLFCVSALMAAETDPDAETVEYTSLVRGSFAFGPGFLLGDHANSIGVAVQYDPHPRVSLQLQVLQVHVSDTAWSNGPLIPDKWHTPPLRPTATRVDSRGTQVGVFVLWHPFR